MAELHHTKVVDGYAAALLEVATVEGHRDEVADELYRVARAFDSNEELRDTLSDPRVPVERKQAVVSDLLDGRASRVTIALINLLVGAGRSGDLVGVTNRMVQLAAEQQEMVVAEVRSAIELDEETVGRLESRLAEATGRRITARVVVDPTVVGGIVAKVGDTVFDGSVKRRLQELREAWG